MNDLGMSGSPFLFIIDFEMKSPIVIPLLELNSNKILFYINGFTNLDVNSELKKKIIFKKFPINYTKYKSAFQTVKKNINLGNTYLLNLTFPTRIETNLSLKEIFYYSFAKYKLFYKNKFVVFSPEIFVKIKNGIISSYPMKGTIDASIKNADTKILKDKKETAEHNTIVDLIRNDLSLVAKKVRVRQFRYIDRIKTNEKELMQVSSEIVGELNKNWKSKVGDIIFSLLPAGSVSGAPKKKTVEIIKKAENYNRNYYTGIFGYFNGQNLDSGVMIRFIEKINGKLFFKSGGGITAFSNCKAEYKELIDKVYVPII